MTELNQFLLCTAPDGTVKVEVFFKDKTVWLTQKSGPKFVRAVEFERIDAIMLTD